MSDGRADCPSPPPFIFLTAFAAKLWPPSRAPDRR